MGRNEIFEEVHVCAYVYMQFFITSRAGSSVYLKLPDTFHYNILFPVAEIKLFDLKCFKSTAHLRFKRL